MLKTFGYVCALCLLQAAALFPAAPVPQADALIQEAESALARDERDYRAYSKRAYVAYAQGRFDDAEKDYTRALSYAPTEARVDLLYNLGNAYFMQQKLAEALSAWRAGIRQKPDDQDMLYNYAVARRLFDNEKNQGEQDEKSEEEQDAQGDNKDGKNEKQNEDKQDQEQNQGQTQEQKNNSERLPGEMSEEEALRLLRAIQDQEREASKNDKTIIGGARLDKDW